MKRRSRPQRFSKAPLGVLVHYGSHWASPVGLHQEALLSIDFAKFLVEGLLENNLLDLDLEIHVDVGKVGETREIITEVVGMVRGSGFEVKTKPESFGASKVADRHT